MIWLWRYRFTESSTGKQIWSQWMVCADGETSKEWREIAEDLVAGYGFLEEIEVKSQ